MDDIINAEGPGSSKLSPQLSGGRGCVTDHVVSEIKYALIEANKRAV